MLLSKVVAVASLAVASSLAVFAVGCSAPAEDVAEGGAAQTAVGAGDDATFRLYDNGSHADADCDVHTVLMFANRRVDGGLLAELSDVVEGTCRINVEPDPREYALTLTGTECGSKIYKGASFVHGVKRDVTITDNRERICRDVVPAIVVEETSANDDVHNLHAE